MTDTIFFISIGTLVYFIVGGLVAINTIGEKRFEDITEIVICILWPLVLLAVIFLGILSGVNYIFNAIYKWATKKTIKDLLIEAKDQRIEVLEECIVSNKELYIATNNAIQNKLWTAEEACARMRGENIKLKAKKKK